MIMRLSIVIPCYNEEEVLAETARCVCGVLNNLVQAGRVSPESSIYFVDDGSTDRTWALIESLAAANPNVAGIKLSRNRGHQNALMAGLFNAPGDAVVSMDADLQDDVNAVESMLECFENGAEVVYGVRKRRDTDTQLKRLSAEAFYKLLSALGAESVYNHADYRLLSRRAIECLSQYREVNLYLRGIVPLLGFRSAVVYYDRVDRFAGTSKYPLRKMLGLALDAITSFSIVPLRFITLAGFLVFAGSMVVSLWALGVWLFTDNAVPGWTSIVLPLYFLGGIQILCIGIIGEYLGKTYSEVKERPRYFIERIVTAETVDRRAFPAARRASETLPS